MPKMATRYAIIMHYVLFRLGGRARFGYFLVGWLMVSADMALSRRLIVAAARHLIPAYSFSLQILIRFAFSVAARGARSLVEGAPRRLIWHRWLPRQHDDSLRPDSRNAARLIFIA